MEDRISRIFGFASTDQLVSWFDDDLNILDEIGYKVSIYYVSYRYVWQGSKQIIFDKEYATRVRMLNISDLDK